MDKMDRMDRLASSIPFDDVVIRFRKASSSYHPSDVFEALVRRSPKPLSSGAFQFPKDFDKKLKQFKDGFLEAVEFDRSFYSYENLPSNPSQLDEELELSTLVDKLYQLLPEPFREGFPSLVQSRLRKKRGIRLILQASLEDKAASLLSLPWELCFAQEKLAYLSQTPRLIIVRQVLDAVNQKTVAEWPDYHVLHVIADDPTHHQRELFRRVAQMERQVIPKAITPERYTCAENPGSLKHMQEKLDGQQVLHFLGHGKLSPPDEEWVPEEDNSKNSKGEHPRQNPQRGYLKFISEKGKTQSVTGEQLQHLLAAHATVQLVVLNACHSGTSAAQNMALELTYSGLPYVVAMQAEIDMLAAEAFTQAFYEALKKGYPFDYAVALGRSKIVTEFPGAPDWCLPVLYTNRGLLEPKWPSRWAERIWKWFSQAGKRLIPRGSLLLGAFLLVVGLLLLLSGAAPAQPDVAFLVRTTTWLITLPPLVAIAAYLSGPGAIPSTWTLSHRAALAIRLLAAASVGLGFSLFCFLWLGLTLLLSLGFWTILSPLAQFLLLIPAFALSVLVSYAQTIGFRRAFISDTNIEQPEIEWKDLTVALAGYLIMFMPLAVWIIWPWLLAPPMGTLLVGGILLAFGIATRRQL